MMRDFFISNGPLITWIICIAEAVLMGILLVEYRKEKYILPLLMGLVSFGLFYDAFVMGMGSVIQNGFLKTLSILRFVFHGALVPLILPICAYALNARDKILKYVWLLTGVLIVLGVIAGFRTVLEPRDFAGIVRYASSDLTPGWADKMTSILSFGTVLPLMACGVIAGRETGNYHLLFSGLLMFVFSALGPATGNFDLIFLISLPGELLMVIFFLMYWKKDNA